LRAPLFSAGGGSAFGGKEFFDLKKGVIFSLKGFDLFQPVKNSFIIKAMP
jgi:hypothetical protein